jgi:hypothetical protein
MSHPTQKYTERRLDVGELTIDRRVQRQGLNTAKVEHIYTNYNPASLGIITVSLRKDRSYVVVDGQHRVEATRRITDNQGDVPCRVFEGLTLAEEAQMFLDLNTTTVPTMVDKFKVSLNADSPAGDAARSISELVGAYGFTVSRIAADGHINAVSVLQRLYALSQKIGADPNLIQVTIMVISRAWGNNRYGVQAPIFEGIARIFAEYGSLVDVDRLINVLKEYQGGPQTLASDGAQLAAIKRAKKSMGVAETLVGVYNSGKRTKTLSPWRART